jgi:hypothetical protein
VNLEPLRTAQALTNCRGPGTKVVAGPPTADRLLLAHGAYSFAGSTSGLLVIEPGEELVGRL